MPRKEKTAEKATSNGINLGYEAELWRVADVPHGSKDAAEYKYVVLSG